MSDQTSHHGGGRRPHFHRGRRGQERRGGERRTPPSAPETTGRDHVDVEQIMRDIRARIALRHGIELSNQQVQELAARRLEALLEPRNVNPSLLEQLRKSAGNTEDLPEPASMPNYAFEDTTLYDTHRGILRFIRRLLNPILKLFFNPATIVEALHKQAEINAAAAEREIDQERQQAEWNALHFELLQRMVTEVSRLSIDMQALSMRIESLSTKVDFNERRVRAMENPHATRAQTRQASEAVAGSAVAGSTAPTPEVESAGGDATGDAPRRRRRRRRGRRGGAGTPEGPVAGGAIPSTGDVDDGDTADLEGADEDFVESVTENEPAAALEPSSPPAALQPQPQPALPPAPMQPEPPRDEPTPVAPSEHADSGPSDR